jgi:hypothetical protein
MNKGIFRHLARYQRRAQELEALTKVWETLSPRARAVILITAGVCDAPHLYAPKADHRRAKKGELPPWLMPAMNLLKDSDGQLSDRDIAQRIGVSHSTLIRNETYMRARQTNRRVAKPRKVFTGDPGILARLARHKS